MDKTDHSIKDPDRVLSFTVGGPWAHFRRLEGNIVKQTYRVIPRTTISGLIAAVLGISRDQYYEYFSKRVSAVAISIESPLRTMNLPQNTLSTADEHINRVPPRSKKLRIGFPDPEAPRQQHNYETLVNPEYRIDFWCSDQEFYRSLHNQLENDRSYYTPCLGLSEHLADLTFLGEYPVEKEPPMDQIRIDSAVPGKTDEIIIQPDDRYGVEQSPGYMKLKDGKRITEEFITFGYDPEGGSLKLRESHFWRVDGRNILFT